MCKQSYIVQMLCVVLWSLGALAAQQAGTTPVPIRPTHPSGAGMRAVQPGSLVLTADPDHEPMAFSPEEFGALPHVTVTVHNGHTDKAESYSGVPLAALLAKVNAPLGKELHGKAMTSYVIASGSDGYSVVLSLAEVDPDFHEGPVIVADARDGKPLGDYGPFQLIVAGDKRPARWVHNLNSIELRSGR